MAGFSRLYVLGSEGGFLGSDGVSEIAMLILVGDASRQWLEPHYVDNSIKPIGRLRVIVPPGPDDPDSLIDACIGFFPQHFESCPSFAGVESALQDTELLDMSNPDQDVFTAWTQLRDEARDLFSTLNIWQADLARMQLP